jgi:hypothetical protein
MIFDVPLYAALRVHPVQYLLVGLAESIGTHWQQIVDEARWHAIFMPLQDGHDPGGARRKLCTGELTSRAARPLRC